MYPNFLENPRKMTALQQISVESLPNCVFFSQNTEVTSKCARSILGWPRGSKLCVVLHEKVVGGSGSSIPHKVFAGALFGHFWWWGNWNFIKPFSLRDFLDFHADIHFAPPSLSCSSRYISVKTNIHFNSETLAIRYLLDLHCFKISCKGFTWNLKHFKQKEPCSFQLIQKTNTQVWYDFLPPQKKSLDFSGESSPFFGPNFPGNWWRYPENRSGAMYLGSRVQRGGKLHMLSWTFSCPLFPQKTNISPWKSMVGRWNFLSKWSLFLGGHMLI